MYAKLGSNGGLSKNFHGVGICPLSKILASKFQSDFENLYFVENHTRDLCQTKLFACPIGNLAFKQRVIERGEPLQICTQATYQVCERRTAKLSNLLALLSLFTSL
jgi:hypothetical protein